MKIASSILGTVQNRALWLPAACSFIAGSALLTVFHIQSVSSMQEEGLPAALNVSRMEKRAEVLAAQEEVVSLQAALRSAGPAEVLAAYVLPADADLQRPLAYLDAIFQALLLQDLLQSIPAVSVEDDAGGSGSVLRFRANINAEGLRMLEHAIGASGLLTVADVLKAEDIERLLELTENEAAESIGRLEHFLNADLLAYSQEHAKYEEQLQQAFRAEGAFEHVSVLLRNSALQPVREALAPIAPSLLERRAWPPRLLSIESVQASLPSNPFMTVEMVLRAHIQHAEK